MLANISASIDRYVRSLLVGGLVRSSGATLFETDAHGEQWDDLDEGCEDAHSRVAMSR